MKENFGTLTDRFTLVEQFFRRVLHASWKVPKCFLHVHFCVLVQNTMFRHETFQVAFQVLVVLLHISSFHLFQRHCNVERREY